MKKTKLLIISCVCVIAITLFNQSIATYSKSNKIDKSIPKSTNTNSSKKPKDLTKAEQLYTEIGLDGQLSFEAFENAIFGLENLNFKNKNIITIIDFSRPSTEKRMFVIDLYNKNILFHTIVSHGRNSGDKYATSFSNRHGSYQSSLGFYTTENTYQGRNGYSLVLNGLEKGINDQAKARAVVVHGADYCSESFIKSTGRLGRSYGCPALPRKLSRPIINTIKNGSMVYIHANNKEYLATSKIIKNHKKTLLAQHSNEVELNDSTTMSY